MKKLELKKVNNFDHRRNLLGILKNAPARGFTMDEVRTSVKIIDKLGKDKRKIELEDAEYNFIKKVLEDTKFILASKELVGFLDLFKD